MGHSRTSFARHAELISASIHQSATKSPVEKWALKRVQGDKSTKHKRFIPIVFAALCLFLLLPTSLTAQTLDEISIPDEDRIEAARELLAIMMPEDRRAAMVTEMVQPMIANINQGMLQAPAIQSALRSDPQAQVLVQEMLNRQQGRTTEMLQASLPGMFEAMTRAYARRFTEHQMEEIGEFFETDEGQAYLRESNTIMADPDIAAWQRGLMHNAMGMAQADIAEMQQRLAAMGGGVGQQETGPVTNRLLDAMRGGGEAVIEDPEDQSEQE